MNFRTGFVFFLCVALASVTLSGCGSNKKKANGVSCQGNSDRDGTRSHDSSQLHFQEFMDAKV